MVKNAALFSLQISIVTLPKITILSIQAHELMWSNSPLTLLADNQDDFAEIVRLDPAARDR